MGYITDAQYLIKKVIRIPEADVQVMDPVNTPFTLIQTNNLFTIIPVVCFVNIDTNQTTPYSGWGHLHLTNTGDLQTGGFYNMLINAQTSPVRIGGTIASKDLQIFFETPISAGDGDMIVTLYYIIA
jgi:hypothetical protein